MKFVFYLFLFLLQTFSLGTLANKDAGNGGDVVACRNPQNEITSIEMLDYYEARELRQIMVHLDIGETQMVTPEAVKLAALQALKRIEPLNPFRFAKYSGYVNSFFDETLFVTGKVLTDIPDSDHLFLPVGCHIEQIAIQTVPRYQQDRRYVINQDLWIKLPFRDAVGLVLHEVIYRELIAAGFANSVPVRYYNSLISSDAFANMALSDYAHLLAKIPLPDFDYHGLTLALCIPGLENNEVVPCQSIKDPSFFDESNVTLGDAYVVPPGAPWADHRQQIFNWNGNDFPIQGLVSFDYKDRIIRINLSKSYNLNLPGGTLTIEGQDNTDAECIWNWKAANCRPEFATINFYSSGKLYNLISVDSSGTGLPFSCSGGPISFFENGAVQICSLPGIEFNSDSFSFLTNGNVQFNEDGTFCGADDIAHGFFHLANPDNVINQVTAFMDKWGKIQFTTGKSAKFNFVGSEIEVGPGSFTLSKKDLTLEYFELAPDQTVKLTQPANFFGDGVTVSVAAQKLDDTYPRYIILKEPAVLNSPTGRQLYPANSRIYFAPNGQVESCFVQNTNEQRCHLQ